MTPDKGRGISGALTDPPTLLWRATVRVRLLLGGNVCPRQVLGPGQCHAFVPTETGPGLYDGLHRILPTHYQDGSYGTPLGSYARLVNPGDQTLPALCYTFRSRTALMALIWLSWYIYDHCNWKEEKCLTHLNVAILENSTWHLVETWKMAQACL